MGFDGFVTKWFNKIPFLLIYLLAKILANIF